MHMHGWMLCFWLADGMRIGAVLSAFLTSKLLLQMIETVYIFCLFSRFSKTLHTYKLTRHASPLKQQLELAHSGLAVLSNVFHCDHADVMGYNRCYSFPFSAEFQKKKET